MRSNRFAFSIRSLMGPSRRLRRDIPRKSSQARLLADFKKSKKCGAIALLFPFGNGVQNKVADSARWVRLDVCGETFPGNLRKLACWQMTENKIRSFSCVAFHFHNGFGVQNNVADSG